jgi:hypothetical protein
MSAALCLACGGIKHGAVVDCGACGAQALDDNGAYLAFTDHHLDVSTLEEFGRVIKHLNAIAPDQESALMSFFRLITERHPDLIYNVTTPDLAEKAGAVLHLAGVPEIKITDSTRALREADDVVERLTLCRVVHRQLRCKRCGHTQSIAVWQRINPSSGAVAYALLRDDKLFEVVCRGCGNTDTLRYEALYIDGNAACAIWLKPRSGALDIPMPKVPDAAVLMELDNNFRLRIVETPEEFAEKVRIFMDGWDDIHIELTKLSLCVQGGVDITDPPTYRHTSLEAEERRLTFDGSYPHQCSEAQIEETVGPVAAKLKSRGYAAEGVWQRVSTISMMDTLVAAELLIPTDPPAE